MSGGAQACGWRVGGAWECTRRGCAAACRVMARPVRGVAGDVWEHVHRGHTSRLRCRPSCHGAPPSMVSPSRYHMCCATPRVVA
jgi:hypothetical protein